MSDHHRTTIGAPATEQLGATLGAALQPGDLLTVDGDLGAGKTVLVRGLATGLGVDPTIVRSPTFVLHHIYTGGRIALHHIDCYRLGAHADVTAFDLDELLADGAVAMEWGSLAQLEQRATAALHLDVLDTDRRIITLRDGAPQRLTRAFTASQP